MSLYRSPTRVSSYDVPAFPAAAAHRDRTQEARERSQRMRDLGYQEGYAEGHQAGQVAAEQEVQLLLAEARSAADRFNAAAAALDAAALDLRARDHVTLAELERDGVALGVGIAQAVVGRELESTDEPVLDAMRRAAQLLPDRGTPIIRVHPADEATVREAASNDPGQWTPEVSVVADANVEPGGCVVDIGPCRVDAQIATALDRMRSTLLSD